MHLFEAERQSTFHRAALDCLAGQPERSRTGGAVVVDIDHRDAGLAEVVQGLLNLRVLEACVLECRGGRACSHDVVVVALTWLGERDHADPGYKCFTAHRFSE
ncbi:Uncharacterised protein [Mycobacteroides abscessus subsp. abscessus]|nr:Uncharacterised protein [Mycobacteroides abscessus subsp. abscessus]